MPIHLLNQELWFPPVTEAMEDGLLAIGGDLSTERLLLAYRNGIFPWFSEGEPPHWYAPNPRFVLFPQEVKMSKSMQQLMRKNVFEFKTNVSFDAVIHNCQTILRQDQDGTWITKDIVLAYQKLHEQGIAHSAEAWHEGKLVGGLYGVKLGKIFFGESMFSLMSNASKFAFIQYVQLLQNEGVQLIDCQVQTTHLASLGARMIERTKFISYLNQYCIDIS